MGPLDELGVTFKDYFSHFLIPNFYGIDILFSPKDFDVSHFPPEISKHLFDNDLGGFLLSNKETH